MKIAIIGWGSLIWDPRNLEIDKTLGENGWHNDGPILPIEFSRISNDGRLTLVIDSDGSEIQTLFAISAWPGLDEAILDLAVREGCNKNKIGLYLKKSDKFIPDNVEFRKSIKTWMDSNPDIEAVIWTNLPRNFKDKIGVRLTPKNAVNYLNYQTLEIKKIAEQYIRRAPEVVRTPIRNAIEKEFGWIKVYK
jgi:hypothetical protein